MHCHKRDWFMVVALFAPSLEAWIRWVAPFYALGSRGVLVWVWVWVAGYLLSSSFEVGIVRCYMRARS